jgi:hypothetical protein
MMMLSRKDVGIAVSYRLNTGCEPSFTWQVKSLLSAILAEPNLKPIRFVFESIAWPLQIIFAETPPHPPHLLTTFADEGV